MLYNVLKKFKCTYTHTHIKSPFHLDCIFPVNWYMLYNGITGTTHYHRSHEVHHEWTPTSSHISMSAYQTITRKANYKATQRTDWRVVALSMKPRNWYQQDTSLCMADNMNPVEINISTVTRYLTSSSEHMMTISCKQRH